ncbi:hypothetical protein DPEC_G00226310 [Dallia pectoralis]|uniref:Uncharacterized protein n=1 Tax=Dallia pectoralis TaxID=75939 RepID=A0ACC2G0R0_DALPE|nr:hypothetical protein DPEC_G00226310 [Dallia pectoralis]
MRSLPDARTPSDRGKNKLEALLLLGDAFVEDIQKHNTELQTQKVEVTGKSKVTWWKRACDGQRVTTEEKRLICCCYRFSMC